MIDDRSSFVYNLVHGLESLGVGVTVRRLDRTDLHEAAALEARAVVVAAGVRENGRSAPRVTDWIEHFAGRVPVFGVGPGHGAVAAAFGAAPTAGRPVHGKTSPVLHDGTGLFAGLPSPFTATRYDGWTVREPLPPGLEAVARTGEGDVMALRHRTLPVASVQFDPASTFTEAGQELLANVVEWAAAWWESRRRGEGKGEGGQ